MIADEIVWQLHGEALQGLHERQHLLLIPSGEAAKSLDEAKHCWLFCKDNKLDRRACILSLGGGATTDLAGFVAAGFMRGIDVIHIPTTLLAMVDAAIGGKTGVNLTDAKNYVGAFHAPRQILCHLPWLSTLAHREYVSGFAEVIKYGLIADPELFCFLEENAEKLVARDTQALRHIVERSIQIKSDIVEQDFKEQNLRQHLNLGHTFAHAIESATDYTSYLHGEAVAIGLCASARTSQHLGMQGTATTKRVEALCSQLNIPTQLHTCLSSSYLISLMKRDKKSVSNNITLIVSPNLGEAQTVQNIPEQILQSVWREVGADAGM